MKKLSLSFLSVACSFLLHGQIPNYSFENLSSSGAIKNWGALITIPVVLDSNHAPTDTLVVDNQFYFSSPDAHWGNRALEMRNAYYKVSGQKFAGCAALSANDTDYISFSVPVSPGNKPLVFSFYYKFFSVNNDTAYAFMNVTDSTGNTIGQAEIFLSGTVSSYSLASMPVIYTGTGKNVFLSIGFSTSKPYSGISYGTRLLVDDVNFTGSVTGTSAQTPISGTLHCFPNPTGSLLTIQRSIVNYPLRLYLSDISGRQFPEPAYTLSGDHILIQTEDLPPGLYVIQLREEASVHTLKFIK